MKTPAQAWKDAFGDRYEYELSPPVISRIRAGFETTTPLRSRGVLLPKSTGPKIDADGLNALFDDDGAASDGFDRFYQAEADFQEVCENGTGTILPDAAYQSTRDRREKMDAQTIGLATAAECRGQQYYYGEKWTNRCTIIEPFSKTIIPMPPVRRVAVLPSVAAQQRSKMLRDVEFFLSCHPLTSRMYTITNGPRVPLHPIILREETKGFHRWLSKMAANKVLKRYGLQFQWRATEFGTPKWDPETGQMTMHLHAHVLVKEPDSMHPKRRGKLRKKLWRLFGTHWDDAGRIENAREFVKYPVKPGDLETIQNEGGPGMLADFFDAVKGLHIVQPMGALKAQRARRRSAARRLYGFRRADGRVLEERYDVNAGKRPTPPPNKTKRELRERVKYLKLLEETQALPFHVRARLNEAQAETEALTALDEGNARNGKINDKERASPRIANRIVSRLAPAPYGGPICAPAVVVWGFDGNLDAVLSQPVVRRMLAQHGRAYADACAARALAQECAHAAEKGSQRSNNCPRRSAADWQRELVFAVAGEPDGPPDGDSWAEN